MRKKKFEWASNRDWLVRTFLIKYVKLTFPGEAGKLEFGMTFHTVDGSSETNYSIEGSAETA